MGIITKQLDNKLLLWIIHVDGHVIMNTNRAARWNAWNTDEPYTDFGSFI